MVPTVEMSMQRERIQRKGLATSERKNRRRRRRERRERGRSTFGREFPWTNEEDEYKESIRSHYSQCCFWREGEMGILYLPLETYRNFRRHWEHEYRFGIRLKMTSWQNERAVKNEWIHFLLFQSNCSRGIVRSIAYSLLWELSLLFRGLFPRISRFLEWETRVSNE